MRCCEGHQQLTIGVPPADPTRTRARLRISGPRLDVIQWSRANVPSDDHSGSVSQPEYLPVTYCARGQRDLGTSAVTALAAGRVVTRLRPDLGQTAGLQPPSRLRRSRQAPFDTGSEAARIFGRHALATQAPSPIGPGSGRTRRWARCLSPAWYRTRAPHRHRRRSVRRAAAIATRCAISASAARSSSSRAAR